MIDRAGLAEFLRRRRESLQPEDVGLPRGQRRRTSGLRREEVAALCHMSTDYYSRLERERGPQPSEQMIASIAQGLHLSLDERDHLFRLAGHHPPPRGAASEHISPGLLRILDRLSDTPAEIVTELGETLRQTPLGVALTGDLTRLHRPGPQHRLPVVHRPGRPARCYAPEDHAFLARMFASGLRGGRHAARPRVPGGAARRPAARAERGVPRACGTRTRSASGRSEVKRFIHPEVGALELNCQTLLDPDQSHSLLVYTAVPGQREPREAADCCPSSARCADAGWAARAPADPEAAHGWRHRDATPAEDAERRRCGMDGLEVTVLLGASVLVGVLLAPRLRVATPLLLVVVGLALGFVPELREVQLPPGDDAAALPARHAVLGEPHDVAALHQARPARHRDREHPARRGDGVRGRGRRAPVRRAVGGRAHPRRRGRAARRDRRRRARAHPAAAQLHAAEGREPHERRHRARRLRDRGRRSPSAAASRRSTSPAWCCCPTSAAQPRGFAIAGLALPAAAARPRAARRSTSRCSSPRSRRSSPPSCIHGSGVLAVVAAGLAVSYAGPRISTAASRRQTEAAWPLGSAVLNGALFVLIGLEVQLIAHETEAAALGRLVVLDRRRCGRCCSWCASRSCR